MTSAWLGTEEEGVALSTAENFERIEADLYARYPLVGEDVTDFRGVVYVPILARHREAEQQELALVFEDGEVVGLVTVTDLLESVVGNFEDPIDTDTVPASGSACDRATTVGTRSGLLGLISRCGDSPDGENARPRRNSAADVPESRRGGNECPVF